MKSIKSYSLKIEKIFRWNDYITIHFKQPSLKKFVYQAGQFLTLNLYINNRRFSRSYSFSSSPALNQTINITIKKVKGGVVSNFLFDNSKEGDILEAIEAMGDFTFNFDSPPSSIVLWGAGSGITPLYSILNEVLLRNTHTKIHLIYCNRYEADIVFSNELILLQEKYPDRFKLILFLTRESNHNIRSVNYGRLDKEFIQSFFVDNEKDLSDTVHYICGPYLLKNFIVEQLLIRSVDERNIHTEDFFIGIDEEKLSNVVPSNAIITFKSEKKIFLVARGKSILEASIDEDFQIPYSCQVGICDTCKAKIVAGSAIMVGVKDRKDLGVNEVLLCCTFPTSNQIEIEL